MREIKLDFSRWNKMCKHVEDEFLNFMDGLIVAEALLGKTFSVLDNSLSLGGKYKQFTLHQPVEGIFDISFYVLPGSTDINVDIREFASIIEVEKLEELKGLEEHQMSIIPLMVENGRAIMINMEPNRFYKFVKRLSTLWHPKPEEEK